MTLYPAISMHVLYNCVLYVLPLYLNVQIIRLVCILDSSDRNLWRSAMCSHDAPSFALSFFHQGLQ